MIERLLVFNLATDADDPILGFTHEWLRALAARVGNIDVITMTAGRLELPGNVNVHSVGKERGLSEPRRALEFYRILAEIVRSGRPDACFAHMAPLFAVMAAPVLYALGVPITLWYAHGATSRTLRLAERVVQTVVTPSPESFRLTHRKVRVVGHGIDTGLFRQVALGAPRTQCLLTVGRVTPVKRLEIVVSALPLLGDELGFRPVLRVVGPIDAGYGNALRSLANRLGVGDCLELVGPLHHAEILGELERATVVLNVSATGSVDKAALEAMAAGVPVVVANEAFGFLPEVCRAEPDPADVARQVATLMRMGSAERNELGRSLREIVVTGHSLERLADLLVDEILPKGSRR